MGNELSSQQEDGYSTLPGDPEEGRRAAGSKQEARQSLRARRPVPAVGAAAEVRGEGSGVSTEDAGAGNRPSTGESASPKRASIMKSPLSRRGTQNFLEGISTEKFEFLFPSPTDFAQISEFKQSASRAQLAQSFLQAANDGTLAPLASAQDASNTSKLADRFTSLASLSFAGPSKGDFIGGVTLGLILMAQSVAHAGLCGLQGPDLIHGPYSCILPPILYALLGSSKHGSVGTGSLVALLTGEFIKDAAIPVEKHAIAAQVVCMTTIVGIVLILMRLLQLQALVKFLSRAALAGFVNASAILIIESQAAAIIGLRKNPHPPKGFPQKVYHLVLQIADGDFYNWQIGALGLAQLVLLFGLKAFAKSKFFQGGFGGRVAQDGKLFPALKMLIKMKDIMVVGVAFCVSYYVTTAYDGRIDLKNVGQLQSGLPRLVLPPSPIEREDRASDPRIMAGAGGSSGSSAAGGAASSGSSPPGPYVVAPLWRELFPGGIVVAFIVFLSSFAGAKKFALQDGTYKVDATKELNALGSANLVGAFFGAVPVQVGLSRMAIGYDAGVQSVWGGNVIVAVVVVILSLFLTPMFHYVPQSTLAAIIISGASSLFDFNIVRYLYNMEETLRKKRGFWIHMCGLVGTLLVGVAQGILIPGFLSVFLLIKDATKLRVRELGKLPKTKNWRTKDTWKTAKSVPDILVLRLEGNLTFSNADTLFDEITKFVGEHGGLDGEKIKALVLDMNNVALCDFSAIAVLEDLAAAWRRKKKFLIITAARDNLRMKFERLLMPLIPNPSLLLNVDDGVTLASYLVSGEAEVKGKIKRAKEPRRASLDSSGGGMTPGGVVAGMKKRVSDASDGSRGSAAALPPSLRSFMWAKFNSDELDEMHSKLQDRYIDMRDDDEELQEGGRIQRSGSMESQGSAASPAAARARWQKMGAMFQSRKSNATASVRLRGPEAFSDVAAKEYNTEIADTASLKVYSMADSGPGGEGDQGAAEREGTEAPFWRPTTAAPAGGGVNNTKQAGDRDD